MGNVVLNKVKREAKASFFHWPGKFCRHQCGILMSFWEG